MDDLLNPNEEELEDDEIEDLEDGDDDEIIDDIDEDDEDVEDDEDDSNVPKSALLGVKRELKQLKQINQNLQNQLNLYQANINQNQNNNDEDDEEDENDFLTVKQFRTLMSQFQNQLSQQMTESRLSSTDGNARAIVEKYLPRVINKNPAIARRIDILKRSDPGAAVEYAYEISKNERERLIKKKSGKSKSEKIIKNSKKPGVVKGSGHSNMTGENYWKEADDEAILKEIEKIKRQG